ncbi:acyl carrier protein [Kordiimonas lipolytica]|uniref:Acyl carrier protein n=1 Tax=Kordiimonas lipolytica TaxID=1662421 RepID=A0ABV8U7E3_9PROT|nr:phosphopantetheine-binding protein [Kordiimonas lipolytica]
MAKAETIEKIYELIEPLNKKGIDLAPEVTFASDLELDSLTVMDLVADIEDEFDIVLPLNLLPELETIAHVADAVEKILEKG